MSVMLSVFFLLRLKLFNSLFIHWWSASALCLIFIIMARNTSSSIIQQVKDLIAAASVGAGSSNAGSSVVRPSFNHMDSTYANILNSGLYNIPYDQFIALLHSLGINQEQGLSGSQRDDWNKQLLDTLLNYASTQENRAYNESLRDEQRRYDDPSSQLSRLTGAGISRDAAIQLLSGGAAAGGAAAPYSTATAIPEGIAASQSKLNGIQQATSIVGAATDVVGTAINLASLGLSAPQSILGAKLLKNQHLMSQSALSGFNAANNVATSIANAVTSGAIDQETVNSFSNASDVLQYLDDHRDTNAFKGLFNDGSFDLVYGTRDGRDFFNQIFHSMKDAKTYGSQVDNFIRSQDLQNSLAEIQTKQQQRDYFFGLQKTLNDLIMQDEEIGILWNNLNSGAIEVLINGERFEQAKIATKISNLSQTSAEHASYREKVEFDAFQNFVENGEPDEPGVNATGQEMINYMVFSDWYRRLQSMLVTTSNKGYERHWAPDGSGYYDTSYRQAYADYLRKNQKLVYTGLLINEAVQSGRLSSWNGDHRSLWQFVDMWNSSGASDLVSTATGAAADVAVPFLIPKAPVNALRFSK